MAPQRRLVHYSGNVQGVGFRYTALRVAGGHDVTGCVRNLPDGRVEIVVEGEKQQIEVFLEAIRNRMAHYIDDVRQQVCEPTGEFRGFNVRF